MRHTYNFPQFSNWSYNNKSWYQRCLIMQDAPPQHLLWDSGLVGQTANPQNPLAAGDVAALGGLSRRPDWGVCHPAQIRDCKPQPEHAGPQGSALPLFVS